MCSIFFYQLKMQSRVVPLEEGKDPGVTSRTNQSKALPIRLLQLFVFFLAFCITFSVISIYTIRHFGISNVMTTVTSSIQPCYEEPNGLDRWIKPPSNLMHTMNDKQLLWRASFKSRRNEYPFERVPKIALMFLTKGPLPLAPIWERFLKGHQGLYSIYVHSLPSFQPHFPPSSVFYGRHIPSQVCIIFNPFVRLLFYLTFLNLWVNFYIVSPVLLVDVWIFCTCWFPIISLWWLHLRI